MFHVPFTPMVAGQFRRLLHVQQTVLKQENVLLADIRRVELSRKQGIVMEAGQYQKRQLVQQTEQTQGNAQNAEIQKHRL